MFRKLNRNIFRRQLSKATHWRVKFSPRRARFSVLHSAPYLNTVDLRVIIIGGGISAAGDFVFTAIKKSVQSHVMKPMREDITVLPAKLGNSAGILGAAGLVL